MPERRMLRGSAGASSLAAAAPAAPGAAPPSGAGVRGLGGVGDCRTTWPSRAARLHALSCHVRPCTACSTSSSACMRSCMTARSKLKASLPSRPSADNRSCRPPGRAPVGGRPLVVRGAEGGPTEGRPPVVGGRAGGGGTFACGLSVYTRQPNVEMCRTPSFPPPPEDPGLDPGFGPGPDLDPAATAAEARVGEPLLWAAAAAAAAGTTAAAGLWVGLVSMLTVVAAAAVCGRCCCCCCCENSRDSRPVVSSCLLFSLASRGLPMSCSSSARWEGGEAGKLQPVSAWAP